MSVFQVVLLAALVATVVLGLVMASRGALPKILAGLLVGGACLGAVFVVEPDWTTQLARFLGIGRGADLVLYVLVLGTSWGFLSMYMRVRAVRRDMTLLVRRMALDEAERDQTPRRP
ncbi:MAG: DUF2304 domain-containing protein [Phycisphaerae bacterium]|nr:DUF2304 domain-containing protein [Phycisphaerae bacterium]